MTMQMPDVFFYRGEKVEAIAISSKFQFTPMKAFGIETIPCGTANYRGFWCDYVIDDALIIKTLHIVSKNRQYPLLNGKKAVPVPEFVKLCNRVKNLDSFPMPMEYQNIDFLDPYTGAIVIGVGASDNKAGEKRYRKLFELWFEKGILLETTDITGKWKAVNYPGDKPAEYIWWLDKKCNYYELLNYDFMGVSE